MRSHLYVQNKKLLKCSSTLIATPQLNIKLRQHEIFYMGKQDYDIEKVHLGNIKSLLNIKPSSCIPSVYAECRRFPVVIKQTILALKYWKGLLGSNDNMAIRNAYNNLYE